MLILWHIFRSEVQRYFRSTWSNWGENLSWFLYTSLIFIAAIAILSGVRGSDLSNQDKLLVLVGWMTWIIASDCMSQLPEIISEESETGTLEQLCLTSLPLATLLAIRSLAYLLGTGLRGLISAAVLFFFVAPPTSVPSLLILFLISLVGAFGLGFAFAGLALVFKRVEAITSLVFSLMIFFTGSLVGLERLGIWYNLLKFVFPLTWGISLMRQVVQGQNLIALWSSLAGLLAHSIVFLLIGLGVFVWGDRKAREKGSLGHY